MQVLPRRQFQSFNSHLGTFFGRHITLHSSQLHLGIAVHSFPDCREATASYNPTQHDSIEPTLYSGVSSTLLARYYSYDTVMVLLQQLTWNLPLLFIHKKVEQPLSLLDWRSCCKYASTIMHDKTCPQLRLLFCYISGAGISPNLPRPRHRTNHCKPQQRQQWAALSLVTFNATSSASALKSGACN